MYHKIKHIDIAVYQPTTAKFTPRAHAHMHKKGEKRNEKKNYDKRFAERETSRI